MHHPQDLKDLNPTPREARQPLVSRLFNSSNTKSPSTSRIIEQVNLADSLNQAPSRTKPHPNPTSVEPMQMIPKDRLQRRLDPKPHSTLTSVDQMETNPRDQPQRRSDPRYRIPHVYTHLPLDQILRNKPREGSVLQDRTLMYTQT
jgi:hypothetical protein